MSVVAPHAAACEYSPVKKLTGRIDLDSNLGYRQKLRYVDDPKSFQIKRESIWNFAIK